MVSPTSDNQASSANGRAERAFPRGTIAGRNVSNETGSNSLEFVTSTISSPSLSPRDLPGRIVVEGALTREPTAEELENLRKWVNQHTELDIATIDELSKIKRLELQNKKLTELPNSIGFLKQLKWLLLAENQLTSLTKSIGLLSQLNELWLDKNHLTSLPESISLLSQLEYLYLGDNKFTSLPESIGSLSQLKELFLDGNQLTSIPSVLGRCLNLTQLTFHHNQDLATLPMSLGQIPGITDLDITDTKIPPDERDAILAECRALRAKETNKTLPRRIETWKIFAKSNLDLGAITEFDEQQKRDVNEWLVRLERTSDFSREQHALASIVCNMLKTVIENQEFREQYFSQIGVNLEACEDRAAMSLNEIYTSWRLATLPQNASIREKLKLMTQAAKTFALREVLAARINDQQKKTRQIERESVEIYLYYEIVLQKKLDLLTAIKHMSHGIIGKRDWIQEEDLIKIVEANYFNYLLNIPAFEKIVAKEEWFQKIDHQFQEKLEELESKREPLSSAEYVGQINAIKAKRKETIVSKTQSWLLIQMGGGNG